MKNKKEMIEEMRKHPEKFIEFKDKRQRLIEELEARAEEELIGGERLMFMWNAVKKACEEELKKYDKAEIEDDMAHAFPHSAEDNDEWDERKEANADLRRKYGKE